jgi:hypothetical protein
MPRLLHGVISVLKQLPGGLKYRCKAKLVKSLNRQHEETFHADRHDVRRRPCRPGRAPFGTCARRY